MNRLLFRGTLALCALTGLLAHASAATVSFGQFTQAIGSPTNPFVLTNNGTATTLGLTGSIPVNFNYLVNNGYNGTSSGSIAAMMTFSATVLKPATTSNDGFTTSIREYFDNVVIHFTADTPINGHTDLLTVSSSKTNSVLGATGVTGRVDGDQGGATATLTGDTATGGTVGYQSDFLSFNPVVNENYSLSFSSLLNSYGTSQVGLQIAANNYLESFATAGAGTFASDPAPNVVTNTPEPGAMALLLTAGTGSLFGLRRRRK